MIKTTKNNNLSNEIVGMQFPSLEFIFESLGSTLIGDIIDLFINPIVCLFGLISNLIAFRLLFSEQFKSIKLYNYLKVYLINSALLCLTIIGFLANSRRFLYLNSYASNFYVIHIGLTIVSTCYFYAGVLDILIILDRIFLITNKNGILSYLSTFKLCSILFLACLIINFPQFFIYEVVGIPINLSVSEARMFYFFMPNQFGRSSVGTILMYIVGFFRDFFTLASQIVLNIVSLYFLKRHLSINDHKILQ
jgi:hypothetical protein